MKNTLVSTLLLGTILSFPAQGHLTVSTSNYLKTAWEKPSFFNTKDIYSASNTSFELPVGGEEEADINNTTQAALNYNNLTVLSRNKNSSLAAGGMSDLVPTTLSNSYHRSAPVRSPQTSMPSNVAQPIAFDDSAVMPQNKPKNNNFSLPAIQENRPIGNGQNLNAEASFHIFPTAELPQTQPPQSIERQNFKAQDTLQGASFSPEDQVLSASGVGTPSIVEVVPSNDSPVAPVAAKKPADQEVVEVVPLNDSPVAPVAAKKPADQEVVDEENAVLNNEFSAPPPAPPPPPLPGVIKGKQLVINIHDLNKVRLTKKPLWGAET